MDFSQYQSLYQQSINSPTEFWTAQADRLDWIKRDAHCLDYDFAEGRIRWFDESQLNVCYNCVDRHLDKHSQKTALIWESDTGDESKHFSYEALHLLVCKMANVLQDIGVRTHDRVCLYLPMIPEAIAAMLACARIGAIHSVVFAGFSAQSLASRIDDAECAFVITADFAKRGGKKFPLKTQVDESLQLCQKNTVKHVLVIENTGDDCPMQSPRDLWYSHYFENAKTDCPCVALSAESPLFILYTSGSTGQPKGVMHTQAGYLLYASLTHEIVFNLQPNDIYWCTADIGWITGHSYIVYGPLSNAATTVIFEGVPTYPSPSRCWDIVDKHQVSIFYTAPTAIRSLMKEGDTYVKKHSRNSLRVLGTVGEPINPEAWRWYHEVVGEKRCPIVDTWWQTETGGILITPIADCTPLKPGSASLPFFGVQPVLLDDNSQILSGEAEGNLAVQFPWPGIMRDVYQHHQRFINTYFTPNPGFYTTGDKARRDADGYYWITGRIDDVINVSGHRLSTAEIESALVLHPSVAEAAVVGVKHQIKGQAIEAYVTLCQGVSGTAALKESLIESVKTQIGSFAKPEDIIWAEQLPKTRSGKIMRRLLRKISAGELDTLGDTSTLADPGVVEVLLNAKGGKS